MNGNADSDFHESKFPSPYPVESSSSSDAQELKILCIALTLYSLSLFYTYFAVLRPTHDDPPNLNHVNVLNSSSHSHGTHATATATATGNTSGTSNKGLFTNASTAGATMTSTIMMTPPPILTTFSENMRKNILQYLVIALALRCLCLLLEYYAAIKLEHYYYYDSNSSEVINSHSSLNLFLKNYDGNENHLQHQHQPQPYEITYIVARTLPFQSFIIVYTGIVMFYRSIVQMASGQFHMVPNLAAYAATNTTSAAHATTNAFHLAFHGSQSNMATVTAGASTSASNSTPPTTLMTGPSSGPTSGGHRSSPIWTTSSFKTSKLQRMSLDQWNIYGYGIYFICIVFNCIIPVLDGSNLQMVLGLYFSIWYVSLWIAFILYSGSLMRKLKRYLGDTTTTTTTTTTTMNMTEHPWKTNIKKLGLKMMVLFIVCSFTLLGRAFLEVRSMWNQAHYHGSTWDTLCIGHDDDRPATVQQMVPINIYCSSKFIVNVVEYILLEWIPAITAALMLKKHSSSFSNTNRDPNGSSSQFIKRKPFAVDRESIMFSLETGQSSNMEGQTSTFLPRVDSNSSESPAWIDTNRSNSANAGMSSAYPRMNNALPRPYSAHGTTNNVSGPSPTVSSMSNNTVKKSISAAAGSSSEIKPLLGESQSSHPILSTSTISYGGV